MRINNRTPELYFYEWSVSRWRASATRAALDSAGRSVYRECLDLCYAQGKIPKDLQILAAMCGCTMPEMERTWAVIRHHFQQDKHDENALRHKEADVVRRNFFASIRDQKRNAQKGGHAKARKLKKIASDSRENSCLITEQNITEQNRTEPPTPTRQPDWQRDESYRPFREAMLATGASFIDADWAEAHYDWTRLDWEQKANAIAGIPGRWSDPALVQRPKNYIRRREWNRKILTPKQPGPTPQIYSDYPEFKGYGKREGGE